MSNNQLCSVCVVIIRLGIIGLGLAPRPIGAVPSLDNQLMRTIAVFLFIFFVLNLIHHPLCVPMFGTFESGS